MKAGLRITLNSAFMPRVWRPARRDVLVPTVTDRVDGRVLSRAGEQLRLIANSAPASTTSMSTARPARHHRHQHAGRADRRHGRHDHGADPRRAAPHRRRREGHRAGQVHRLVADLDARPPHHRQAPRHHRHGPHRPGGRAPRQSAFGLQIHYHNRRKVAANIEPSSRRPIGIASTRCCRAHGHRVGELPAHAGDLSPALGAPARS
jgi:hypothetical protein